MKNPAYQFETIAIVHSPFKEKFGTPRQPGLVKQALFSLEMLPPYDCEDAFEGLEDFSHLWLTFVFHQNRDKAWSPKIRPPRLGGNQRVGVFASRSPYRPNPIGLSVVEFIGVRREQGKLFIDLKGADLIEGTPVLDIKPYIPYADAIHAAHAGYASQPPDSVLAVQFSELAQQQVNDESLIHPDLEVFIKQVLELDPRPAYVKSVEDSALFGMKLLNYDIQWQVEGEVVTVLSLNKGEC